MGKIELLKQEHEKAINMLECIEQVLKYAESQKQIYMHYDSENSAYIAPTEEDEYFIKYYNAWSNVIAEIEKLIK